MKTKKSLLLASVLIAIFGLGFAFGQAASPKSDEKPTTMKKVTGIGGVFFKCKDPKKLREWYKKNLGINAGPYGASFDWRLGSDPAKKGVTQWAPFADKTKYFEPSTKEFMINYRVENLEALVEELKQAGIMPVDKIEKSEYGKFVHLLDLEGNKIELWEPADADYEKTDAAKAK